MSLLKTLFVWLGAASNDPTCNVFLAPSEIGGWGVYAARDFEEAEVVEIAPLFLPIDHMAPVVKNSVLDDYHYGIHRDDKVLGAISLGMVMFYNHDKEPNVRWTTSLGRGDPSWEDPNSSTAVGFVTRRAISQGEELFSTYDLEDDGAEWFASRRIPMAPPSTGESKIEAELLDDYRRDYCSKAYSGFSLTTYQDRVKPTDPYELFRTDKLPSTDAPTAIAKVAITAGDRIEKSPALVLSKQFVSDTSIAPLVFTWDDLEEPHHEVLKTLRIEGQLKLQYQNHDTNWHRVDRFESFQNTVIFPAAGNIGTMERVGENNPNCAMDIKSSGSAGDGSAGLVLEIFALKDIEAGETLRLNLPPTGTDAERRALLEILETTGQLIPDSLRSLKSKEAGDEL